MRFRLTVSNAATGVCSDVVVECDPADTLGSVLELITAEAAARGISLHGRPTIAGAAPEQLLPVAESPLREGVVLRWGDPGRDTSDPFAVAGTGHELAVISGPSAGLHIPLRSEITIEIGRAPGCGLVLADGDVSRRHASIDARDGGFDIADLGSANGVLVDGTRITRPHRLRVGEPVQLGASRVVLEDAGRTRAVLTRATDGVYLLNRRFPDRREPFSATTVALPMPVADDDSRGLPVLAMVLPLFLAVAMALFLKSPLYLLFGLLSPVMLGGNWWSERRRRRTRDARQVDSYASKLSEATRRIDQAVDDEDADLRLRFPDPVTVARTALELRRELWSRRPGSDEWLNLRLGVADRPASVTIAGERPAGLEIPLLHHAPVGIDLDDLGVLGIAGPQPWLGRQLSWVLTQAAVSHSPDELRLAVLAPNADEAGLGWLRWLPHLRTSDGHLFASWSPESVEWLLRRLGEMLERRGATAAMARQLPEAEVLVVLVGAGSLAQHGQVADLMARGVRLGMRFVCAEQDDRRLPESCRAVLIAEHERTVLRVDRGTERVLLPDQVAAGGEEAIARTLAALRRVGDTPSGGLPDAVRFTEMHPIPSVAALTAAWRSGTGRTDVLIGRESDGASVIDIARHGPHAVVAGTSGSGKSELLQTWVAALALANSPEQLSVVFMDYKGGAAFRDLADLPHVVGTVTNLDERLAVRALSSLEAELIRRQEQLRGAGASDRADYIRRAAVNPDLPPFPRLLIVVDELAEMKDRLPTFVDGLVGVARIGRSLGVHLVLATQKPAGVIDAQIRANVDLRICLRTRDEGESLDVIEVGDAARIPKDKPGRALVVRGDAPPTMVQTARVTTPHTDGAVTRRRAIMLRWSDATPSSTTTTDAATHITDLNMLVKRVAEAAAASDLVAPYRPWTPPLPEIVSLGSLLPVPSGLCLGLRDDPARQRQEPASLPLGTGHLVLVGSGRTGRTSALRAFGAGLARANSPRSVHVHVIDGSGGLAGLARLPHVGVVADEDDPVRLERLLTRLVAEVRRRRKLLTERGFAAIQELGQDAPPAIVLLVDDWHGVVDGDGPAQTAFTELLAGTSVAADVTVCVAGDERLLRARLLTRFPHRLCLRLNNPSDATALGIDIRNLPSDLPLGRALWAADGTEVQLPLLDQDPSGQAQSVALASLAADLHARYGDVTGGDAPMRLQPLPTRIAPEAAATLPPLPDAPADGLLIGVAGDSLASVYVPFASGGQMIVAGPARSGRSTAVAGYAASAAKAGHRTALVVARAGEVHRWAESRGAVLLDADDLSTFDVGAFDVVVVDDIEWIPFDDTVTAVLTGRGGPMLIVAGLLDSFGYGARGLLQAVKKQAGSVVLLSPPNHLTAEYVGVRINRSAAFTGPPGRAFLLVNDVLMMGQIPDPTLGQ